MTKVRIVAAIVDTRQLTLYKEDGKTVVVPQGDVRVRQIIDQVLPIVQNGGVAEVDLDFPNHYKEFEEMSQGMVTFFRVARKVVDHIFNAVEAEMLAEAGSQGAAVAAGTFGAVPPQTQGESDESDELLLTDVAPAEPQAPIAKAVDEIIANAKSVSDPSYSSQDTTEDDTMIAVVEDAQGDKTVIPGVEALKDQFRHSAANRNTVGVQNLLKRMAGYVGKRAHSVEDLLRFLERGDLPIADDGSIIAYKILKRRDNHFVDCHTKRVPQKVGSFVCVSEDLVDKSRRNECSNGLHIARRGYLGNFPGDVVTLCKIAPEDVIVVPHNDPNKVRVCGYHILAELPESTFTELRRNRPMTENKEMSRLLGRVLKGQHVARLEEVRITEQRGGGVKITPLTEAGKKAAAKAARTNKAPAPEAKALDDRTDATSNVSPKDVSTAVVAGGRQAQAKALWNAYTGAKTKNARWQAATALVAFKKKAKVAWPVLGIDLEASQAVIALANLPEPAAPAPKMAPAPISGRPTAKETIAKAPSKSDAKAAGTKATELAERLAPNPIPTGTRSEIAKALFKAKDWAGLAAHKKQAKVGWEKLGFSSQQIEQLTRAIAKLG